MQTLFSYGSIKSLLASRHSTGNGSLTAGEHFFAALGAGIMTTIATNPLNVLRTRLVMDRKKKEHSSPAKVLSGIWKSEGLRGMYKGIGASVMGVSHGAVQLVIYEQLKEKLVERGNEPVG
jgi:solute carrier family 25 folate transporter 32